MLGNPTVKKPVVILLRKLRPESAAITITTRVLVKVDSLSGACTTGGIIVLLTGRKMLLAASDGSKDKC
jgi:hypothetical protein